MIENVIGVLGIPVGIATNFRINGRDYLVPMATEEPSVVAAASNAARMARERGGFFTSGTGPVMQAQIQLLDLPDPETARLRILEQRSTVVDLANEQDPTLVRFGGGATDLQVRLVPTRTGTHVVTHLVVDVRDAMGANAVNTMAEAIAPRLAAIAGGRPLLRILTNMADRRIVRARAVFDRDLLGGEQVVDDIVHASALAEADPYRAATHNKGIMNGITAAVLASGNDTRAVEAGCHSHAVGPDGRYTALSHFEKTADGHLSGTLEVPMAVGLVGGATKAHPVARAAIKILGVESATELAEVVVAVGLAQNLGACRALAAEGIQRGHMSLHARTVAVTAGARTAELDAVVAQLIQDRNIRVEHAERVLADLRNRS
jgi:hydroxymethylglutaryl-CoA reductase